MYNQARKKDMDYKARVKQQADIDQKRNSLSSVRPGDLVLVKFQNPRKNQPVFDPNPFTVKKKVGNRVYLKRNGKDLCRPLHFIKRIPQDTAFRRAPSNVSATDDSLDFPTSDSDLDRRCDHPQTGSHSRQPLAIPNLRNTLDMQGFQRCGLICQK